MFPKESPLFNFGRGRACEKRRPQMKARVRYVLGPSPPHEVGILEWGPEIEKGDLHPIVSSEIKSQSNIGGRGESTGAVYAVV